MDNCTSLNIKRQILHSFFKSLKSSSSYSERYIDILVDIVIESKIRPNETFNLNEKDRSNPNERVMEEFDTLSEDTQLRMGKLLLPITQERNIQKKVDLLQYLYFLMIDERNEKMNYSNKGHLNRLSKYSLNLFQNYGNSHLKPFLLITVARYI